MLKPSPSGAGVGVSWGVGADITKISPVPGISLAFVGGASIKADLVGGYGSVVQKILVPVIPTSNNGAANSSKLGKNPYKSLGK